MGILFHTKTFQEVIRDLLLFLFPFRLSGIFRDIPKTSFPYYSGNTLLLTVSAHDPGCNAPFFSRLINRDIFHALNLL